MQLPERSMSTLFKVSRLLGLAILVCLFFSACTASFGPSASSTSTPKAGSTPHATATPPQQTFPTTPAALRTPVLSSTEKVAPTVKVLASIAPSLIVQVPLFPSGVKAKFPNATALVTIVEGNPDIQLFDTITVDVQNMPPNVKYTVFFIELANKPFGHAQYVGDVFTNAAGSGESIFHLITLQAFAANASNPGTSPALSGEASGIQFAHIGMWFDGISTARRVLGNNALPGTPFDGGARPLHAGPQAMTDGQTLPVI